MHKHRYGQPKKPKSRPKGPMVEANKKPEQPEGHSNQSGDHPHKFWEMTRFEWIMCVLTLFAAVIAGITGVILWKQVEEMRVDQRAWINAKADKPVLEVGQPISINIQAQNTGKSLARDFHTITVVELIKNGDSPDFDYSRIGRTVYGETQPDVFPNETRVLTPYRGEVNPAGEQAAPIAVTLKQAEHDDLVAGKTYLAVHGRIWYQDIFHVQHWKDYCFWDSRSAVPMKFTSASCIQHNGEDDN